MAFQVLRIVLLNCHYRMCAKMSMSGKFAIPSGNCHGNVKEFGFRPSVATLAESCNNKSECIIYVQTDCF